MDETKITYPLGRDRHVTIDPRRQFGEPCVAGRVSTDTFYGMFSAGETIAAIARWYALTPEQVEDAIRYEVMRRCRHGRAAIKEASVTENG